MANPLFNSLFGGENPGQSQQNAHSTAMTQAQQGQPCQASMQDAMRQLQAHPAEMIRQAGFQIPDGIANNPQAAAMHLIQSGQVRNPVLQRIQPMINMLMGHR